MGKEKPGFLTPKAIANRIKAKGLQKLRWYCQMCQKQCRDENGFKCHAMSESHQRQLLLFAENTGKFMDEFSREFNKEYLNTLKRRFGTKRVHANVVYQEYISDRNHIHMNATKWLTLSDYVKWLGKQGLCNVEETEKGWFVTYIDRDPETLRRQMELDKKKKLDLDDRQRQQLYLEKQIERAKELENKPVEQPTELKKGENERIKISFFNKKKSSGEATSHEGDEPRPSTSSEHKDEDEYEGDEVEDENEYEDDDDEYNDDHETDEDSQESLSKSSNSQENSQDSQQSKESESKAIDEKVTKIKEEKLSHDDKPPESKMPARLSSVVCKKEEKVEQPSKSEKPSTSSSSFVFKVPSTSNEQKSEKRKLSALDEIIEIEEKKKEKMNRKDYWLHKNIVVKIITNRLGEKYYKKKAVVVDVVDKYTGVVKLLDSETTIKLDQAHLETVLPALGKQVLVLNGAYRGEMAILEDIDQEKFCANISIASGPLNGRVVKGVQYEDISKLNQ